MPEVSLTTFSDVVLAVSLLSPGFLISYFKNTFISGRHPRISERIVELLIISSVYYASFGAIFVYFKWLGWIPLFLLLFLIPMLLGLCSGVASQKRWFERIYEALGLNPIHPATTGWDFLFGTMDSNKWIVVTLSDGTKIRGWFDRNSGASTDLSRRDIYINDIRREDFSNFESDGRKRGIWLHEDEIRHIEVISD
ncbi:hypothetical protein SAMN05216196_101619 [Lutimaribacter pacificus]|uniref:Uncharacterized protein n=1 Tax=Lutimaribacter pacificus TaxID=391948 RepID=A0A1H0BLU4_9RHOB|nr:DUF6338 family protein [Lutimaribacter pacificus]SDN46578.1 hypothetical protein SAMN05216196_101619 [Lutimaribacter pacificus]SHJ54682.1 hypothetical protein SAMN05444142_101598 [Lutimaribacter pacificus]